jgi:hypothetical protein
MSNVIHRGSPEHDAHLIGVERDRLIAENQDKINELKEKRRVAFIDSSLPFNATAPILAVDGNRPNNLKVVSNLYREISDLENPVISRDVLNDSRQADYKVGFEIGRNRQRLNEGASDQKQAGYAAGMSSGPGGSATSPQTAFGKSESELNDERLANENLTDEKIAEDNKTKRVPQRKI